MTTLFFSNCSFASFNKIKKWILNVDIVLPKKTKKNPNKPQPLKRTDKKEDTKEHTWNDEKEQWYCTTSGLSSQILIHVIRYVWIQQNVVSR